MSDRTLFKPLGAAWQVPDFRIDFWLGRTSRTCVVIPVINEGARISAFLSRLQQLAISKSADVLIVDGGSSDGSLAHEDLIGAGVRGLLTKTGPGRLSAQLRVAYAFALAEGHVNIITIDGNNKDDPSPIPDFIAGLDQGFDFVQASRFLAGGQHSNTPLSRLLAIRLLHAPVLSLASGFTWTDTTQGFRAYSARALIDERVAPFRDLFQDYELLAYLSYRLPKLGFRCTELPSVRDYPPGEVPTKISGFRGNLKLIRTLLKTCLGAYDPPA